MNLIPLYSIFEVAFPVSAPLAICTYGESENKTISVAKCFRMNKKLCPTVHPFHFVFKFGTVSDGQLHVVEEGSVRGGRGNLLLPELLRVVRHKKSSFN